LFSYQIGGSERVGVDLAIEFRRRGYEVVCFAFYDSDGPLRPELAAAGIECVDLNYEARKNPLRRLTYQAEFFRFLKTYSIDSLVVHHATALILCGLASRFARVRRTVMIEHAIHQLRERPKYRRSAMRYMRYAQVVTGVDQKIIDYFRDEMAVPANRLRYIPNGVRIRARNEATRVAIRQTLGIAPKQFVFLFVGRLQPVKDAGTLLEATALLPKHIADAVRIVVAGDGPERERLAAQAHALGIVSRVSFLGARKDIDELLMGADAFIMTSITEGQPMALIEAMAAGIPCVATSVGGIPALLRDGAGVLVPPSRPSDVAQAMAEVATTPKLRAKCVAAAKARVLDAHSLNKVTDAYLAELGLPPSW
jgi:glycosyltransferase involved in cell wall biosynthesis